ncbi:polysaccharide deacetylase family protein [Nocardia huaxiensis]|uniref:Polysaccharide deacetylase family protein n=1 Tax=Nocardia huaxiensis TaxID=2755382 RepID=A0A7D6ZGS7_9NOCA|nr:polysaccharide deacetylase family protein [Nocardia huaxiensis]QLY30519.1 polysaccharide deacetylase family protein [Nocardia huaxiensis]
MAKITVTALRTAGSVLLCVLTAGALTACGSAEQPVTAATSPPPATTVAPDPAAVGANELGLVPVLMYHRIDRSGLGEYDQTPEKFRAELDRLYRENYRPITVSQYASGDFDLAAGTHPVVLTFDDSTTSQVSFTADGAPAPDTAVAILEEFRAQHPDFGATATFFVNNEPFANDARALPWLTAHGYEVGAHTASHANLARLDGTGVQRELVENVRAITAATHLPVRTLALPLGISPTDRALASAGTWEGTAYAFDAVMLVGAEPAPSPYGPVDLAAVPRIRSGRDDIAFTSGYWLDKLAAAPADRYTSDGDPSRISFPQSRTAELAARWSARANAY